MTLAFLLCSQLAFSEGTGEELQELIDSSCLNDGFVRLDQDYRINEPIYVKCSMDAQDNTVYVEDGSIRALVVQGLSNVKLILPHVINVSADPGNGLWTDPGTGVYIVNVINSHIEIANIRNFKYGLALVGNGQGTAYNNVHIRHLENNQRNLLLQPWNRGWVNQNNFYGGRYSHWSNEGEVLDGVSHIVLVDDYNSEDPHGPPNNNTWFGASLEGNVAKYAVDISGDYNVFYNSRWESINQVIFRNRAWGNVIHYGYGVYRLLQDNRVVFETSSDATKNKVISSL
ncbi:hypothetical protein [Microbulbifer sp. TYP-18]|uniref:hypothetical protein n=1 Tax=Microbulbifer sp. TYP-18 TaxID=3230024 RepID=UPI0034C653B9